MLAEKPHDLGYTVFLLRLLWVVVVVPFLTGAACAFLPLAARRREAQRPSVNTRALPFPALPPQLQQRPSRFFGRFPRRSRRAAPQATSHVATFGLFDDHRSHMAAHLWRYRRQGHLRLPGMGHPRSSAVFLVGSGDRVGVGLGTAWREVYAVPEVLRVTGTRGVPVD